MAKRRSKQDRERALRRATQPAAMLPPMERGQHDVIVIEDVREGLQSIRQRARVLHVTVLDNLFVRKWLTDRQHEAGLRVASLFCVAKLNPKTTVRYDELVGHGTVQGAAAACGDAYDALRTALRLLPRRAADVVWRVCCDNDTAGRGENMTRLRDGLDHLADHERRWWDGADELTA